MIVNDLLKPSPLMATIMNQLNLFRNAYEGGSQFKRIVLVKKPSESPALYQDKLNNVAALPICKSMVQELTDIIFDDEPSRELAFLNQVNQDVATPAWFDEFLENADLQNNEFTDFMENVAQVAAVEGWAWVFVDLPETPNPNNRPYLTLIPAQHVIDWKVVQEDGISILTYVKVVEYATDTEKRVKIWERGTPGIMDDDGDMIAAVPTTATSYLIPLSGGTPTVATVEPEEVYTFPDDYPIPVIQVIPVRDIQNSILGVSDLTDLADLQREWLRLEAEAYDSIRFSKPIIRVDDGLKVPAGGGGIVKGPKDCMEVFAIPTMDVASIQAQQASLITQFDGFTGRAGTRNIAEQVSSGISIVEERKSLHKKAQARARAIEKAEEAILDMVCYMMGLVWAGDVEYNKDYEDRDTQYKMALLQNAKALSLNPIIQNIIDQEVIRMIAPPELLTAYLEQAAQAKLDINSMTSDDYDPSEQNAADQRGSGPMSGSTSSDAVQNGGESAARANMNNGVVGSL